MKPFHHLLQVNIPWSLEHILEQVAPGTPPVLTTVAWATSHTFPSLLLLTS